MKTTTLCVALILLLGACTDSDTDKDRSKASGPSVQVKCIETRHLDDKACVFSVSELAFAQRQRRLPVKVTNGVLYKRNGQYLLAVSDEPEADVFVVGTSDIEPSDTRSVHRSVGHRTRIFGYYTPAAIEAPEVPGALGTLVATSIGRYDKLSTYEGAVNPRYPSGKSPLTRSCFPVDFSEQEACRYEMNRVAQLSVPDTLPIQTIGHLHQRKGRLVLAERSKDPAVAVSLDARPIGEIELQSYAGQWVEITGLYDSQVSPYRDDPSLLGTLSVHVIAPKSINRTKRQ